MRKTTLSILIAALFLVPNLAHPQTFNQSQIVIPPFATGTIPYSTSSAPNARFEAISTSTLLNLLTGTTTPLWRALGANIYNSNLSGNVGIGTTTPNTKLGIYSSTGSSENLITVRGGADNSTEYTGVRIQNNADLNIFDLRSSLVTGGIGRLGIFASDAAGNPMTERLSVLSSGNVGIGTTTPTTGNLVVAPSSGNATINAYSAVGSTFASLTSVGGSTETRLNFQNAGASSGNRNWRIGLSGSTHVNNPDLFSIDRLNDAGSALAATPFVINQSGYVGIGTTSPYDRLSVVQNLSGRAVMNLQNSNNAGFTGVDFLDATGTPSAALFYANNNVGLTQFRDSMAIGPRNSTAPFHVITGTGLTPRVTVLAGGNVGIGTTSPAAKASVAFSGNTTSGVVNLSPSSDSNRTMWIDGDAINVVTTNSANTQTAPSLPLKIQPYWNNFRTGVTVGTTSVEQAVNTAMIVYGSNASAAATARTFATRNGDNTETLTVLNSGNVGIGTSTPSSLLHLTSATAGIRVEPTGAINAASDILTAASVSGFRDDNAKIQVQRGSSLGQGWNFLVNSNGAGTQSEAMRITSEGLVGIGTTSPASPLTVSADTFVLQTLKRTEATSGAALKLENGAGNYWINTAFGSGTSNRYAVLYNSVTAGSNEFLSVTTTGNVGIGTTSPASRLSVVGDTLSSSFTATSTTATSTFQFAEIFNGTFGASEFAPDSGVVTWIDMPVTSASATGTPQAYNARIAGNAVLTLYSEALGSGSVGAIRAGIGSTTPLATFAVQGTASSTLPALTVASSTGISMFRVNADGAFVASSTATSTVSGNLSVRDVCETISGKCLSLTSAGGSGTVNSGTLGQTAYYPANGTAVSGTSTIFLVNERVGLGTTSPSTRLGVVGDGYFSGTVTASTYLATSTAGSSTLPNVSISNAQAISSAGISLYSNSGTQIALLGAGGGAGVTFNGVVNLNGGATITTATTTNLSVTGYLSDDAGSAGTSGQVLTSTGTSTIWQTPSGGTGFATSSVVRVYATTSSPYTWNKPAGLKSLVVWAIGGGGAGDPQGGSGSGAGAGAVMFTIPADALGSSETVTVGAGAANSSVSSGGTSSFGAYAKAIGGQTGGFGGVGGRGMAAGSAAGADAVLGGAGRAANGNNAGRQASAFGAASGGCGTQAGGAQETRNTAIAGGASGASGSEPTQVPLYEMMPGAGGGGATNSSGNGGRGGYPGGGGGCGGSSGNGGAGGDGKVIVIEQY